MNHYYAVPPLITVEGVTTDWIQFETNAALPASEGLVDWNDEDGTTNRGMPGGNVNLQDGQESLTRCRNTSGAQIGNGKVVRITGSTGDFPEIALADALTGASQVLGMTTETIDNNQFGYVNTGGMIRDVNTNHLTEGAAVFLDTSGDTTDVWPTSPRYIYIVGICIRKHASEGVIFLVGIPVPRFNIFADVDGDWYVNERMGDYDGKFGTTGEANMLVIDAGADFVGLGGDTNYIKVAQGGELTLEGTSTRWLDERGVLTGARLESPAAKVHVDNTESGYYFDDDTTLVDYLWTNIQLNHDRLHGADLELHIHWWQASATMPNWLIQWRYQQQGQAKDTSWANLPYTTNVFTYSAGTLCQITNMGEITPPGSDGVSDIVQIRILRDTNNDSGEFGGVDALVGSVYLYDMDIHKTIDTMGSRTEYVK